MLSFTSRANGTFGTVEAASQMGSDNEGKNERVTNAN